MLFITKTCFFVCVFVSSFSLQVTFERAYLLYINPEYVEYAFANVTRFGRGSGYYINIEFIPRYEARNNITINILFYEQRRNEYVRSFVEMHYKICDFISMDPYMGRLVKSHGIACPIKGHTKYSMRNITINLEDFPNVFPFEKGRINFCFNRTSDGASVAEGALHLKFTNDAKSKKNG